MTSQQTIHTPTTGVNALTQRERVVLGEIGDEPIVLSPRDAVRSFAVSGLDALVIGDSVVVKERAAPPRG